MNYRNALREILIENRKQINEKSLINREIVFEKNANYVLTGIRRSGKTSVMQLRIKELINEGVEWSQIAYINFEDERLLGMKLEDLNSILEVQSTFNQGKSYYFFDEIQIVEGWERYARRLADSQYSVWISGSNADMLGKEIISRLGGRYMTKTIYPFSFSEFLVAREKDELISTDITMQQRGERKKLLEEYLHDGGFPESINYADRREYTQSVFSKIYQGDIALRYGVRNDYALRVMFRKIAEAVCNELSYSRLHNTLKTIGISIGKNSVINYVNYAKESFLIFDVENYVYKLTDKECKPKYYYMDNGLLNLFLIGRDSLLLENLVAVNLHKKFDELLHYVRGKSEVDFYIPEYDMGVQVAYSLNDEDTIEREIKGLLTVHRNWKLREAIIVTYDEKTEIVRDGLTIKVVPIDEFLLFNFID